VTATTAAGVCAVLGAMATMAGAADWPCMTGPAGSASVDSGRQLIDEISKARLAWEGEDGWDSHRTVGGGYGSPVVVDGRVYVAFNEPAGDVLDEVSLHERTRGNPNSPVWRRRCLVTGQDVLLCADAATGRTLWKAVLPHQTLNINTWNDKAAGVYTPCVDGDVVMVTTSVADLYALNRRTGEVLWRGGYDEGRPNMADRMSAYIRARKVPAGRGYLGMWGKSTMQPAVAADGVVACPTHGNQCALIGGVSAATAILDRFLQRAEVLTLRGGATG